MDIFNLRPQCSLCGALIGDMAKHQQFHDGFSLLMQQALGLSDEEYERMGGGSPADRDRRLADAAASLDSQAT